MTGTTQPLLLPRYKIGYYSDEWGQRSSTPSGIPDASGSWVRYEDHVAALAAGQAVAPAEPDPTPGTHPPPCDSELFENGVSVGLFDIPKWTAEALCKGIAAATGARVDWHYIAGRVHVKALPAPPAMDGGDAVDAARYRYLRDVHIGDCPESINLPPAGKRGLDAAVDMGIKRHAARAAQKESSHG